LLATYSSLMLVSSVYLRLKNIKTDEYEDEEKEGNKKQKYFTAFRCPVYSRPPLNARVSIMQTFLGTLSLYTCFNPPLT
jgi:hypothetical protein